MRRSLLSVNLACCLSLVACSGDDEGADAGANGDGGGGAVVDAGPNDAGPVPCESWVIEYDLTGSEFEIRNTPFMAGDQNNVVGPGSLRLRFEGTEGGPEDGEVRLLQFRLTTNFTISDVETDIEVTAGPEDCGVMTGTRTSSAVAWDGPVRGYRAQGTVTCRASEFLCGAAGLEVDTPQMRDNTSDQIFESFVFDAADNFSNFTMSEVQIPSDDAGDAFLRLRGTEVSRLCLPLPTCE